MLNNNNSPIAGVNSFKNTFKAPLGSLILETTLQPGDWIGGSIGSSTGYVRVHFWDTSDLILGDGIPYNLNDNNNLYFSKKTLDSDTFVDRSFAVYSCDSNGNPSGDILSVSLTDLKYTNVDFSPLANLENLYLSGMNQTLLNLTTNLSLKKVDINYMNLLESIDITGLSALKEVTISVAPLIASIDLAGLTGLEYLNLNIPANIYNIGDLSSLIEARISSITSESIDFTTSSLEELWMNNCYALNSINVAGISNLIKIDLENIPEIASIDLTGLTGLQSLNIRNMNMANLDLTGLTSLNFLYFNSMSYFDTGDINDILGYLDANGASNGYFYDGQISRSTLSNASFNSLIGKGWTLQIPTTPIEVPGAILTMPTTLQPNDSIDGSVGSSTGYIKIQYWDGTSQILGNGTSFTSNNNSVFSFSKTVSSDDSYLNKTIIAYSCDSHGYPSGNILSVDLNNAKYGAIDFSSLEKLQYLRLVDNSNITSLNLTACSDLYYFNVTSLSSLISVDLSGLTNLVSIISENNSSLSAIGLTGSSILARSQSEIDLGRATENSRIYIMDNTSLNSIDLTGFENLESFNITNAPIGSLNRKLTYIRFFSIRLTTLSSVDLSNCLNIESALIVDNRSLISIDLTNSCSGEGTTRTNINDNPLLESISLAGCGLKNYGIYDNAKIDPYDIDSILAAWDSKGKTNGSFYGGNIPRTTLSNTNYTSLINKGWSLQLPSTPMQPAGATLTIPTMLQPGDSFWGEVSFGTSTGYAKVTYWDGTSQILGNGTVFSGAYYIDGYSGTGLISMNKQVAAGDTYANRSIVVSGCTSTGMLSGDILFLRIGTSNPTKVKTETLDISGLTKLRQLFIGDPTKTNSHNLDLMTDLQHLCISGGNFTNIPTSLNLLSLQITGNSSITSITGTSNMTYLDLQLNTILTSVNVSASTNMTRIYLYDCPITTITGMNLMTKLNWLHLSRLPIASIDLTAATMLDRLDVLSCVNITLPSSMNLANLTNLTFLQLYECKIPSLAIKHLSKLKRLYLRNSITMPFDFENVYVFPKLNDVIIYGNTNWTYSDIDYMIEVLLNCAQIRGYFTTDIQRSTYSYYSYYALLGSPYYWTFQMPSTAIQSPAGYLEIPMDISAGQSFTFPANTVTTNTGSYIIYIYNRIGTTLLSVSGTGNSSRRYDTTSYSWTIPASYADTRVTVKIYSVFSYGGVLSNTGYFYNLNLPCDRVVSLNLSGWYKSGTISLSNASMIPSLSFNKSVQTVVIGASISGTRGVLSSVTFPNGAPNMIGFELSGSDSLQSISFPADANKLEYLVFTNNTLFSSLNLTNVTKLNSLRLIACSSFTAVQMDSTLNQIDTYNTQTGNRNISVDISRTSASNTVYNSLVSKGWTFTPAMTIV